MARQSQDKSALRLGRRQQPHQEVEQRNLPQADVLPSCRLCEIQLRGPWYECQDCPKGQVALCPDDRIAHPAVHLLRLHGAAPPSCWLCETQLRDLWYECLDCPIEVALCPDDRIAHPAVHRLALREAAPLDESSSPCPPPTANDGGDESSAEISVTNNPARPRSPPSSPVSEQPSTSQRSLAEATRDEHIGEAKRRQSSSRESPSKRQKPSDPGITPDAVVPQTSRRDLGEELLPHHEASTNRANVVGTAPLGHATDARRIKHTSCSEGTTGRRTARMDAILGVRGRRHLIISRLADVLCELQDHTSAQKKIIPELDSLERLGKGGRRPWRRLQLALIEVFIGHGQLDDAEQRLDELLMMAPSSENITDQLLYMRTMMAKARIPHYRNQYDKALVLWQGALRDVRRFSSFRHGGGFTTAIILVSMAHAEVHQKNLVGGRQYWQVASEILKSEILHKNDFSGPSS